MRFNARILNAYRNVPISYKVYTLIRCAVCPFEEIERWVPASGRILDCGCGHGIFANLLAIKSPHRHVIGTDILEDKIRIAGSTVGGRTNLEFKIGDFQQSLKMDEIDCYTFIDVLYYVSFEEKAGILKKAYEALPKGGALIIKSIYDKPRWKYWWTVFYMAVIDKSVHRGFARNSYFMRKDDCINLLRDIGFQVRFKDIGRGSLYPNCLYICTKA